MPRFADILRELRTQYLIGYLSARSERSPHSYHAVNVRFQGRRFAHIGAIRLLRALSDTLRATLEE